MSYIQIKEANCKNCYKCLKNCAVKSIKCIDDQVSILEDSCVLCGKCINVCPQQAKSPLHQFAPIAKWLADKTQTVVASIAPSYAGIYGVQNTGRIKSALMGLGFAAVRETAEGAQQVTLQYREILQNKSLPSLITSCCPTVNFLIEKYYPQLLPYLAPVVSPVLAHGRMLKEEYGPNTKVVFIGPCLSKFKEIDQHPESADATLSFQQMEELLSINQLSFNEIESLKETSFVGSEPSYSCIYPVPDGIVRDVKLSAFTSLEEISCAGYDCVSVAGLENVIAFLKSLSSQKNPHIFAELNACESGCINGPLASKNRNPLFLARVDVEKRAAEKEPMRELSSINFGTSFTSQASNEEIPDEATIRSILAEIGKPTPDKDLNCGSCGYPTCREKAIAVYQKKAQLHMCLPFMNDLNQSLSNVTLSASPNYIIVVDKALRIIECNLAAQKLFASSRKELVGRYLYELMDPGNYQTAFENQQSIKDKKASIVIGDREIITLQSLIYVPTQDIVVSFLKDVTEEEKEKNALREARLNAAAMAQKVIENQMIAAQEIASLLGETTAETKVTLNILQKQILDEK